MYFVAHVMMLDLTKYVSSYFHVQNEYFEKNISIYQNCVK